MGGRGNSSGIGGYNRELGGEYSSLHDAEMGMGYGNGGAADQWIAGLSKSEVKSITRYGDGEWYHDFNNQLRQGARLNESTGESMQGMAKTQLKVMNDLDNALDRSVLDNPMTVTRASKGLELGIGISVNGTPDQIARSIAKRSGEIMVDHAYMSTTAKGGNTSWQGDASVVYHIKTPAGKGIGGYVGGVIGSSYHRNDVTEFLFSRGSAIRIDGAYSKDGKVHVNATYVGRQRSSVKYVTWDEQWAAERNN